MRIDTTSFCFGFKIDKENDSGTPAWATSIAQAPKGVCLIDTGRDGYLNIITGMARKSHSDFENLKVRNIPGISKAEEPKSDRDRMMFSVFEKVFVNGEEVGMPFVLSLEREHSSSHDNRLHICYAKYLTYNGHSNKSTMEHIEGMLGVTPGGCWFVSEIYILNQEELHLTAVVVNSDHQMNYVDSKIRKAEWDTKVFYHAELSKPTGDEADDTTLSYLTALRTKPFMLLAGISGTGKSRIVRKLAQATDDIDTFASDGDRWKLHSPANFCLIQVKPNWHNSMDVVGFKSNVGGEHYEYTQFIEFVAKAWLHRDTPFFLCLDEMNLAPVEEYFAEFLSAIESRSKSEDGTYETDPVIRPFMEFGAAVASDMVSHLIGTGHDDIAKRLMEKGLTLPENLIVMGTVNMDETTFSFSRKVLDRAMSVEMNEVDYDSFLKGETENSIPVLTSYNRLLVDRPISSREVSGNVDGENIIGYLNEINAILEGTPFKLGYRAANEALLYVSAAMDFGCESATQAMDRFTLMKVLSRIEGDDTKLRTADGDPLLPKLLDTVELHFAGLIDGVSIPKLLQMSRTLDRDKFVSFWS